MFNILAVVLPIPKSAHPIEYPRTKDNKAMDTKCNSPSLFLQAAPVSPR